MQSLAQFRKFATPLPQKKTKMKNNYRIWASLLVALSALILFANSCEKDNINPTNGRTTAIFNPDLTYGALTDQDGNVYKTISIGSQTWMAENLRTTKYRNGDGIPQITDSPTWNNLSSGAYCNYENTENVDSIATYGRLYNFAAVADMRQVAPVGWHVPTLEEWRILESYLGDSVAGIKLKESGNFHWKTYYEEGSNESGFTALAGGYHWPSGYYHKRIEGGWWTATESDTLINAAFHITLGYNYPFFGGCDCPKRDGYSIRCLKD